MADAVPVSDILCEAMEYLVKLGSNLRVRSENLKEKRIRKDKLRNAHAIQKAASKVLLICELSKKSLENVETGVKKVLSQIDSMQNQSASDGGNSSRRSSTVEKVINYEYIEYECRKLRIRKKVDMKHFTSVKVLARCMPTTMQEKYPVYLDCKLYRSRKKREKERSAVSETEDAPNKTNEFDELNKNKSQRDQKLSDSTGPISDNEINHKELCESLSVVKGIESNKEKFDCDKTSSQPESESNLAVAVDQNDSEINKNSIRVSVQEIQDFNQNKELNRKDLKCKETNTVNLDSKIDEKEKQASSKSNKGYKNKSKLVKSSESERSKKYKHIKITSDSSEIEDNIEKDEFVNNINNTPNIEKTAQDTSIIDITEKILDYVNKDIIDQSLISKKNTCSEVEDSNNLITEVTNTNKSSLMKQILNDIDEQNGNSQKDKNNFNTEDENIISTTHVHSESFDKESNESLRDTESKSNLHDDSNPESRPESRTFIRCVSLDKLMKPGIVKPKLKDEKLPNKKSPAKHQSPKKDKRKKRRRSSSSEETSKENDDEYWIQKRKEAKEFKSKNFIIRAVKLPDFSDKYLHTYNLKRIIQNGTIIYETVRNSKHNKTQSSNVENESVEKSGTPVEVSSAKNALLDDSDSDKSKDCDAPANSAKSAQCQSDSGKNKYCLSGFQKRKSESENENEKVQDSALKIKDKNNKTLEFVKEMSVNNDELKSSLLRDSSDDNNKTPIKNKEVIKSTPPSKRKCIMESMHAKKMLLTYSSSSDTEDEQLRNALKEIRVSLLKEDVNKDEEKSKKAKSASDAYHPVKSRKRIKSAMSKDSSSDADSQPKRKVTTSDCGSSAKDTISQVDENTEDKSNNSSLKMGRSKTNSCGSSSHSSDTQESHDKEIDGLANLKTLIKKHRRRDSTSTKYSRTSPRRLRRMSKAPQISEEGFLKAEDSSDEEASLADSDVGQEIELPAVAVTGLNGDSHLAKDDLLDESDSSTSHNKSSQDVKDEPEDTDDEAVKSRPRKGHATISSDSEAGGSRKKDATVRFSDFDDSEESSEAGKRTKRKKKTIDSDASGASSNEGKKKRRRIKNIDDSDGSGSETENEGRNKHGRKNIRKVMGKNQLEEATKKAAREEKERIARIAERQKLYNNLEFDESGKPDEVVLDKVVLDFDPETKEPLIEVDKGLVKKLKPHQANGIKFMWNACFESVKRIKKDKGSGCILAHCMGLGKTLQVVSLTHTLLIHSDLTRVNRVLVVCPLSTVLNWVNEFKIWLKHAVTEFDVDIYELSRFKQNSERAWQLQQWFSGGGVCVLGYEMFRNLSADNNKKFKKKMLKSFQESLVDPGPDLVVCDEGHLLKNEKTSLSQAMNRVKTLRRIVLTGTPLQNNLKEYYCMVQFVKPNLLGKYNEYLNRFVNPITNGQYTDSTEHDIRIMKRRSHVLHKMLDGAVQRRDYGVLAPFLPPKHEYVLFITLTEVQIKLYQHYLDNYSRRPMPGKTSGFLFPDFQSLQRIWTHPLVLKYNSERYEIMQQKKREREEEDSEGSLVDFIDDDSTPPESSTDESSDSLSDMSDDSRKKKKKKSAKKDKKKASTRRGTRANPVEADDDVVALEMEVQTKVENPTEWWMSLVSEDELDDLRHSHKLVLLFDILRQCEAIGDKLLVFSQSLYSLDLIEHFLGKVDEATQEGRVDEKLNSHVGSWSPGVDYFRLDGSTSCENRSIWCKNFNREDNPRARLFLISTRAGGLGINLVAANRVIIFDVSWNPSHDVQSIFRVYRFGQKKPCYVYRFLVMGTMEEKIYERQVTKQAISKRVIDEQQIDRHYAENDLAELYKFEPHPPTPRELPPLPKDRLFAEMLKEYEAQIYKYHEHDSLLENKEEETLTEEERKAAWEDFENEKTRPPPVPFNYNMGLLAQQQQLASAAMAAMLRKDMPNISDDQIRTLLPLIYNSNPVMFGGYDYGLMQKMSEIYKYAQPGMMAPGMMNPVLNPAGGGMSLGGSSGLQYEPPWQRQQQQQQQIQLQRLMQQQQNMGAKYYAGGLGSRDPVAMALQQQRAREMMLGERGRPRGRPPGAVAPRPRVPPQTGDVVNLDSD